MPPPCCVRGETDCGLLSHAIYSIYLLGLMNLIPAAHGYEAELSLWCFRIPELEMPYLQIPSLLKKHVVYSTGFPDSLINARLEMRIRLMNLILYATFSLELKSEKWEQRRPVRKLIENLTYIPFVPHPRTGVQGKRILDTGQSGETSPLRFLKASLRVFPFYFGALLKT